MTKDKEFLDFLVKFNSTGEPSVSSLNEYQILFNFISSETELSSKFYKALESLQNKLMKNLSDLDLISEILKNYFGDILVSNNKNLFDFVMSWLLNLYYKIDDKEKENFILNIFFQNVSSNNFARADISRKINLEENYFYKILQGGLMTLITVISGITGSVTKNEKENALQFNPIHVLEILQRIFYVQDSLEKKSGAMDKSKEKLIKSKNKKIIEYLVKLYGKSVLDYYIIMICHKIKSNPSKIEIDSEKSNLKIVIKFFEDIQEYFFDLILIPFLGGNTYSTYSNLNTITNTNNLNLNLSLRKFILFVILILIKTFGLSFLNKLLNTINNKLFVEHNNYDLLNLLTNLDFTILEEINSYAYQSIDTNKGYTRAIEILLYEMIGTHNLKFEEKSEKTEKSEKSEKTREINEMNELKILDRLSTLKDLIILIENFIHSIEKKTHQSDVDEQNSSINAETKIKSVYNFYYSLQLRFTKNFIIFPESHKKKYFETQVNIGNINKVLPKYNNNYPEINSVFSELTSLFYTNKTSLIFHNWLTFIFKNACILDAYKSVRVFLMTKKEGSQIFSLFKIHNDVSKFYPCIWKIILDSFLVDSSNRNSEENYYLITNLKFIFYYDISQKSSNTINSNSEDFYVSLSYDGTIILKFFREKFSILSSIFFSDENLIEKILSNKEFNNVDSVGKNKIDSENYEMDTYFELYTSTNTNTKNNNTYSQTISANNNISFSNENLEEISKDRIFYKTKIEILHILCFLLNTYSDLEIVNRDISKFMCDLLDTFIENKGKESTSILDYINNIFITLIKIYKKNCLQSEILSTPIKIIFCDFIKHILNKLIFQNSNSGISIEIEIRKRYFTFFQEIYNHLKNTSSNSNSNETDTQPGVKKNLSNKNCLDIDITNITNITNMIIYSVKELVYKNVDNQSFKNPISLKNMQGLNDIDEKIIDREYLIELLSLLDEKQQLSFYGFYIRFIRHSILKIKLKCENKMKDSEIEIPKSLILLLNTLIKLNWLPSYYSKLTNVNVISKLEFSKVEKLLMHICGYLKDFPKIEAEDTQSHMIIDTEVDLSNFNDEKEKKRNFYKTQYKVMIFENIKLISEASLKNI